MSIQFRQKALSLKFPIRSSFTKCTVIGVLRSIFLHLRQGYLWSQPLARQLYIFTTSFLYCNFISYGLFINAGNLSRSKNSFLENSSSVIKIRAELIGTDGKLRRAVLFLFLRRGAKFYRESIVSFLLVRTGFEPANPFGKGFLKHFSCFLSPFRLTRLRYRTTKICFFFTINV